MNILCPISGQTWESPEFKNYLLGAKSNKANTLINHPIFNLNFDQLTNIVERGFNRGTLSPNETRLLALALFNSTKLIIWESPAIHDYQLSIANNSIVALMDILPLMHECFDASPQLKSLFAQCRISDLNNDMDIMIQLAKEWAVNYENYFSGYKIQLAKDTKQAQLDILERSLSKEYSRPNKHIKNLARYIVESFPIDDPRLNKLLSFSKGNILVRDYYKYIIEYSGNVSNGAYTYPITANDINDLQDMIIEYLDYSDIFCFRVTSLLDKMLKHGAYNRYGLNMMITDIELSLARDKENEFIANNPEPTRGDYAGYNAFFLAKNSWLVAKNEYINNINEDNSDDQ